MEEAPVEVRGRNIPASIERITVVEAMLSSLLIGRNNADADSTETALGANSCNMSIGRGDKPAQSIPEATHTATMACVSQQLTQHAQRIPTLWICSVADWTCFSGQSSVSCGGGLRSESTASNTLPLQLLPAADSHAFYRGLDSCSQALKEYNRHEP
jgi:hypothetical protein